MMRRQTIVFLIPSLKGGGAERVFSTLLRHMDRSRFRLILAVVDMRESVFHDDLPPEVELVDLKCSRVRYALPKIASLIWRLKPDTVFSTLGHLNVALAMIRGVLPNGVRYVARETSLVSQTVAGYRASVLWRWAYRRFYRRFDTVICQSRYMLNDLVEHYDFPLARAIVIHNPLDIERIRRLSLADQGAAMALESPDDGGELIRLVAMGRMSHEKGFDLLIDAIASCGDARIRLVMLGEGTLRSELEALARTRGVSQQVHFAGFQRNPYPFFRRAHACILSSRFEGFPNVVLEALACNTPVIATPALGGVGEILDGVDGCVIAESVDGTALAKAITEWIQCGRGHFDGAAHVARFSVERIVASYERALGHSG